MKIIRMKEADNSNISMISMVATPRNEIVQRVEGGA
jgi:hypothetical protein